MKGAKTLKGLRSNLKFIVNYKIWATLIVFCAGGLVGYGFSLLQLALKHSY